MQPHVEAHETLPQKNLGTPKPPSLWVADSSLCARHSLPLQTAHLPLLNGPNWFVSRIPVEQQACWAAAQPEKTRRMGVAADAMTMSKGSFMGRRGWKEATGPSGSKGEQANGPEAAVADIPVRLE